MLFIKDEKKEWWEVDLKGERVRDGPSQLVEEEDKEEGWWWVDKTYGGSAPELKKEPVSPFFRLEERGKGGREGGRRRKSSSTIRMRWS